MKHTLWERYYIHSVLISMFLFLFYVLGVNTSFFYSSVLNYKNIFSDPFDGAVYPIEFVPDPIQLTYQERKQKYEDIDSKYFIKTPIYDPIVFWDDLDSLTPWTARYSEVITQRLIYTVPYLGTYNFDYKEYVGGHPGVDIIAPEWTPVKNIAHWVVVDTGYQPAGFGHYVVIKHNNISYNGKIQTLYSVYAHLSQILVKDGSKLLKWETLWLVWQTGTATTSHLHFQIEIDDTPFHPFWSFTSQEAQKAWVWFFEAVNIGLWKEASLKYTIHPFDFINKNLHSQIVVQDALPNQGVSDDQWFLAWQDISWDNWEVLESSSEEQAEIQDILEDVWPIFVERETVLQDDIQVLGWLNIDDIVLKDTPLLSALEQGNNWVQFEDFDPLEEILLLDENHNQAQQEVWEIFSQQQGNEGEIYFSDINQSSPYFESISYLFERWIIAWFSDGTFRPKNAITRSEALKVILLSHDIDPITDQPSQFQDISTTTWENTYVNAGVKEGIISLENSRFYPFRSMSRVEALKLIYTLGWVDLVVWEWIERVEIADVFPDDWYDEYVQYTLYHGLLSFDGNRFHPNTPITREEMIGLLYKYMHK